MRARLSLLLYQMKKFEIDLEAAPHKYEFHGVSVQSPHQLYPGQQQYISYIIQSLNKGQNALVQSPTGTGKTLSLLLATLSWLHKSINDRKAATRIIYTSRTHSQLKQILKQLKKTGYQPKISLLGSKDQTCINDDLKELTGNSKQLECRLRINKKNGLFCKFFHYDDYYQKMTSLGSIKDLEEIAYQGKSEGFCPFFYEKTSKEVAHLILMPYNYIFDDKLWDEETGSIAQNSIIIFDEAHNLQQVCQQTKELSFNLSILSKALQHVSQLRQIKLRQCAQKVQSMLKSTPQEIEMHAHYICMIHAHLQTLELPSDENGILMDCDQFLHFLMDGTKQGQFGSIKGQISALCKSIPSIKSDILYRPFWALDCWFSFIQRLQQLFLRNSQKIMDYKTQIAYQGSDIKVSFICLDPKNGFKRVISLKPRSIIVTSGTLSPLNTWPIELGVQFEKPLACPHILSKQQVNGCILLEGPSQIKLNFNYDNRNRQELYSELGKILIEIATYTPNGVIVFFPSYSLLEKAKIELSSVNILTKIYEKKTIFFQKKSTQDFKLTIDSFLKEAVKPKGAMLFALSKGKVAEGLDFSDEKCRAVVIVGVPYPAAKDLKVVAKRKYLDQKHALEKTLNGDQWYLCETIRTINQCIGRIIRNKDDFGSVYLLDERFQKKELMQQISSWARQSIKVTHNYEDFAFKVKIFNQYFGQKSKGVINLEEKNLFTSHLGSKIGGLNPSIKLIKGSISESRMPQLPPKPITEKKEIMQGNYEPKKSENERKQKIIFSRPMKRPFIDQKKECAVCRNSVKLMKNSACVHELCQKCWSEWLKQDLRCPICRVRVRQKYLIKQ